MFRNRKLVNKRNKRNKGWLRQTYDWEVGLRQDRRTHRSSARGVRSRNRIPHPLPDLARFGDGVIDIPGHRNCPGIATYDRGYSSSVGIGIDGK